MRGVCSDSDSPRIEVEATNAEDRRRFELPVSAFTRVEVPDRKTLPGMKKTGQPGSTDNGYDASRFGEACGAVV